MSRLSPAAFPPRDAPGLRRAEHLDDRDPRRRRQRFRRLGRERGAGRKDATKARQRAGGERGQALQVGRDAAQHVGLPAPRLRGDRLAVMGGVPDQRRAAHQWHEHPEEQSIDVVRRDAGEHARPGAEVEERREEARLAEELAGGLRARHVDARRPGRVEADDRTRGRESRCDERRLDRGRIAPAPAPSVMKDDPDPALGTQGVDGLLAPVGRQGGDGAHLPDREQGRRAPVPIAERQHDVRDLARRRWRAAAARFHGRFPGTFARLASGLGRLAEGLRQKRPQPGSDARGVLEEIAPRARGLADGERRPAVALEGAERGAVLRHRDVNRSRCPSPGRDPPPGSGPLRPPPGRWPRTGSGRAAGARPTPPW